MGRVKTYESIVKGNDISEPGIPESFKVLLKELQSLALDMKVLTENHEEINLKDLTEEADDYMPLEKKERVDYVDLDVDRDSADEDTEEDDSIFEDFDDATTTVEEDEDFKSNELFDDFDDLDDLDDDGNGDGDDE